MRAPITNIRLRLPTLPPAALVALSAAGALLNGCAEPAGSGSADGRAGTATVPAADPTGSVLAGAGPTRTAGSGAANPDDDSVVLDRAVAACRAGDFKGFFDAFVRAEPIRSGYTAPTVVVTRYRADGRPPERSETSEDGFDGFPIRVEDIYWRPAASVAEAGEDEYLQLEFDESQGEVFAVSWTRVRYNGKIEGGDDLGEALTPDGLPLQTGRLPEGKLVFRPFRDCWRLVADERFDRRPNDR